MQFSLRIMIIATLCAAPCTCAAELRSLGERDLAAVTGRAGISIDADLGMRVTMGSFSFSDSTPAGNRLTLSGITIDDGAGGNFLLKTSDASMHTIPSTLDVVSDDSGKTSVVFSDSSRINPRYYSVDSIIFAGQELGSLRLDAVSEGPSTTVFSAPATGNGLEFDYTTRLDAGALRYGYNSSESLTLTGIHAAGSSSGAPEDPASWVQSGNFHIGASATDSNKASMVVGTDQNNVTSTYFNLPMQGSVRVEDLSFGGTSFGPIAIDGINAHRLQLKFTP